MKQRKKPGTPNLQPEPSLVSTRLCDYPRAPPKERAGWTPEERADKVLTQYETATGGVMYEPTRCRRYIADEIHAATLAERERCAEVAEECSTGQLGWGVDPQYRKRIAAAIREEPTP